MNAMRPLSTGEKVFRWSFITIVFGIATWIFATGAAELMADFGPPSEGPKITVDGFQACTSMEHFKELIEMRKAGDNRGIAYLKNEGICFPIGGRVDASILDYGLLYQQIPFVPWVKLRIYFDLRTLELWTFSRAVEGSSSSSAIEANPP